MPEGDTVHKLAGILRPLLVGATLEQARLARMAGAERLAGVQVEAVEATGKHLLVRLANGLTLRSHLGMYGSWHRYAPGEPWRKPVRQASIVLWTAHAVLVCFHAREVVLEPTAGLAQRDRLERLGPDLLGPDFDARAAVVRARALQGPDAPLVDMLLDQRVAAGIGNVYKSEVLFLERIAPDRRLADAPDDRVAGLYDRARALLAANLGGGPRITRPEPGPDLWVYGRRREPCLRCGTPIRYARLGHDLRSTYWCPACQPR